MKDSTSTLPTIGRKLNDWSRPARLDFQLWRLKRRLQSSNIPLLLGPFYGEVGFECLYWIPWLKRLCLNWGIPDERLIPMSCSGSGAWYGKVQTAIELYAMRTPQQIRIENRMRFQRTGMMKPRGVSAFDRQILADVAETLTLKDYAVLHPSLFYQSIEPFWLGRKGYAWLEPQMAWTFPLPTTEPPKGLPEHFVAARFYARSTFPMCPQTTDLAGAVIGKIASDVPVVLLNTGQHLDEHLDFDITRQNVTRLTDYATVTPENTLLLQSAVLRQAHGFVGTYGGLSQLALSLKKPSISFFTDWQGTLIAHRTLSETLSLMSGIPFQVHRVGELPMLLSVLPAIQREAAPHLAPEDLQTV